VGGVMMGVGNLVGVGTTMKWSDVDGAFEEKKS
jgi:hypothetical protein